MINCFRDSTKCDPDIVEKIIKFFNSNRESKTLIIATASRIELLDSRLRCPGRLEYEIEVGMPNSNTKSNILSSLLKDRRHSLSEKEIEDISSSTHGYTGSDIISLYMKALSIADQGSSNGCVAVHHLFSGVSQLISFEIRAGISALPFSHEKDEANGYQ